MKSFSEERERRLFHLFLNYKTESGIIFACNKITWIMAYPVG